MRERYEERTRQLCCFRGVAAHTALSILVEIGDFSWFPSAQHFASLLGLTTNEHSSGDSQHNGAITKAGNSHLRRLLIESTCHYNRGTLKKRQDGNKPEVIAYADRACERLRRKYIHITLRAKPVNIAKTAVARELGCFIWGMMTGNIA